LTEYDERIGRVCMCWALISARTCLRAQASSIDYAVEYRTDETR
jgi:hypothetical protein